MLIELVLRGPDDDGDFEVKFLKRFNKIWNGFVFPDRQDIDSAKRSEIVSVLSRDAYNGISNSMDSNPLVFESKNQSFFEYLDSN